MLKQSFYLNALVSLIFLTSCNHAPKTEEASKVEISDSLARFIKIDTAKETNVFNELQLVGEVSFNEDNVMKVYPNASGIAQDIKVSLGDYVTKGQPLVVFHSADIASVQGDLAGAISDSIASKKNVEVTQDLFNNGLASEPDLITAKAGYQKALAQLKKLRITLNISHGEGGDASAVIRAPQTGYILEKKINNGVMVRSDNGDYLFSIGDLNNVWVMANVYEADIQKIKMGMDAEVKTLSYPDKVFHGKVDKISNVLDPVSKVMKIRIQLDNSEHLLKPEMFTNVTLHWSENVKKVMIPSSSVIMENSKNFVVVYKDRKNIATREVTINKEVGDKTFIDSGIVAGDMVISKSQLIIYEALKD